MNNISSTTKSAASDANKIYSVVGLYEQINKLLANSIILSSVRVKGEVSEFSNPDSGYVYFSLKEMGTDYRGRPKTYIIRCAIFNKTLAARTRLRIGDVVTVIGSIGTYETASQISLIVTSVHNNDEVGKAKAAYEMLKKKLEAEGLFDKAHKKEIPRHAQSIGIITSGSGKARSDIELVCADRNPAVQLYLYRSVIQGVNGPASIINGITYFDKYTDVEVIILGRGGGSPEELTTFNDEGVCRAVYNCSKPIVTSTGHSTDYTLADYVADKDYKTPTDVANNLVKDVKSIWDEIVSTINQIDLKVRGTFEKRRYCYWIWRSEEHTS